MIGEVSPAYSIRIAINEIYARKGYDFTGTAYENYFSQKSWYAPVKGKIVQESEINQYEKENIDLLVKMEKKWLEKRLTVEKKINGIRSKMWMSFFHLSNLIKSKKKVYSVDKPGRG